MAIGSDKEFLIRVRADLDDARKRLGQLEGNFAGVERQAKNAGRGTQLFERGMRGLVAAAGAYVSLNMARQLVQEADRWNILQDRIRTATREFGDYNAVSRELFAISQRSGSALETNVALFQRIALAAPQLRATQNEVLEVTEAINQLGVISGASTEAMRNGLTQLSQAFSSEVVRAEELNSVLENVPEIANAIAKGMKNVDIVGAGALRKMVIEGEVLSRDVFEALLAQTDEIDKQFEEIPNRLSRATTRFGNAFSKVLADLDEAVGLTSALADGLDQVSAALAPTATSVAEVDEEIERLEGLLGNLAGIQQRAAALGPLGLVGSTLFGVGGAAGIRERIQELEALREQLQREAEEGVGEQRAGGDGASTGGLSEEEKKAREERRKEIEKTIAALEKEEATMDKTRAEIVEYELANLGAGESQREHARSLVESIEANRRWNEQAERARDIMESVQTPTEEYMAQVEELTRLFNQGHLSQQEYVRTLSRIQDEFAESQDATEDFADSTEDQLERLRAAARGWGEDFSRTLADMIVDGKANFRDLAETAIKELLRILIFQRLVEPTLQGMGIIPAGGSGSGTTSAGVAHSGGTAGSLSTRRQVPAALFAGAPRYHTGGFASDEVPAVLKRGERVLSPAETRAFNAGGGGGGLRTLEVSIENRGTPQQAQRTEGRFDGEKFVVSIITDDIGRGGNIDQTMRRVYDLERRVR